MKLQTIIAACLFAASTAAFAQAPQGGAPPRPRAKARFDCSQAKDPKACEERVAKGKAAHEKARKACEGKQGTERGRLHAPRDCAPRRKDPAACEARAKANVERRRRDAKIREACKDKKGDELPRLRSRAGPQEVAIRQ